MQAVFGGSANLLLTSTTRVVEVECKTPQSWALDLELFAPAVVGPPPDCEITVQTGAGQSAIYRTYRLEPGRLVLPVCGNFVTVDVQASTVAGGRLVALLTLNPGSQAPLAPNTATGLVHAIPSGTTPIAQSAGAGRLIRNETGFNLDIQIGGVLIYSIAAGATLELNYAGAFDVVSIPGGNMNIATLHP